MDALADGGIAAAPRTAVVGKIPGAPGHVAAVDLHDHRPLKIGRERDVERRGCAVRRRGWQVKRDGGSRAVPVSAGRVRHVDSGLHKIPVGRPTALANDVI